MQQPSADAEASKGISLNGIRHLRRRIEQLCGSGYFKKSFSLDGGRTQRKGAASTIHQLPITQLVYTLLHGQSRTPKSLGVAEAKQLSLVDDAEWVNPDDVGVPTYFISHVWKSTVRQLGGGQTGHAAAASLSLGAGMWCRGGGVTDRGGVWVSETPFVQSLPAVVGVGVMLV